MTTRRPYGAGSMEERSPGVWRLRACIGRDPVTGHPIQVSQTFRGSETSARRAMAKLVTDAREGKFERTRATVGQLLDKWLEQIEPTRRPKTIAEYRSKIELHIRPALGIKLLSKLGADNLDAFYQNRRKSGLSETTVHHLHAILSAALNQAVKWGWISNSPALRASPPPLRAKEIATPTIEELNRLYQAAKREDPVLGAAVGLAALTGMRRGELVALKWSDVDLVKGRIRIARSLSVVNGEPHEGPTKTHQVRDIALDHVATGILRDRWGEMRNLSELANSPLVADPYVLSRDAHGGRPVGPDTLTHGFARLTRGLGMAYRLHDLRHFAVTVMVAAGVDWRTVAGRVGHADAAMTLGRYAHLRPETDQAAAELLGRALTA